MSYQVTVKRRVALAEHEVRTSKTKLVHESATNVQTHDLALKLVSAYILAGLWVSVERRDEPC